MFQVQKTEYINKTFRLPTDLVNRLEELAQREDVSLNQLIVQCCTYALENLAPDASPAANLPSATKTEETPESQN